MDGVKAFGSQTLKSIAVSQSPFLHSSAYKDASQAQVQHPNECHNVPTAKPVLACPETRDHLSPIGTEAEEVHNMSSIFSAARSTFSTISILDARRLFRGQLNIAFETASRVFPD